MSQHQFRPDWHGGGPGAELAESLARGFDVFDVQPAEQVDRHGMSARDAREVEVRVPFFWSVGGGRLAGQGRVATPVSTLDLVPTLLTLLGIEHSAQSFDGVDLREPPPERLVFADWRGETAARRGGWKLLVGEAPVALFDLDSDGAESRNRLGEGLAQEAQRAREVETFRAARPVAEFNLELLERLRGLGYVD